MIKWSLYVLGNVKWATFCAILIHLCNPLEFRNAHYDTLSNFGFNDVSGVDFLGTAVDNSTSIEWADITAEPTDNAETYVETSIRTLKVRSTETWDLTITGDDALTNVDGKTIDLSWQYGDSATLAGVPYNTKINVALTNQPATIATGTFTKYIRFRIPYHWGVYPGEYTGTVSIEATTF